MTIKTDIYPIRQFLDLPTSCLKKSTRDLLDEQGRMARSDAQTINCSVMRYGWFVYADEDIIDPCGIYPDDLIACMKEARKRGAEYILFDSDASNTTDLPTYPEEDEPLQTGQARTPNAKAGPARIKDQDAGKSIEDIAAGLTEAQCEALHYGQKKGAMLAPHKRAGGAFRRCCERLAERGLLTPNPPFHTTVHGSAVYAKTKHGKQMADLYKAADIIPNPKL